VALNTTGTASLSDELKTFYDKVLLERTNPQLHFAKFGQKRPIPRGSGKVIEFRRFDNLAVATTPLTEGTAPTLKDMTVNAITATIAQYGDAVGFSDLVTLVAIDPLLTETAQILGDQAAETIDEVVRDILAAGTTVQYANDATSRVTVGSNDNMTVAEIREALLTLKLNRARPFSDGFYHAVIHPRVAFDLMADTEWRDAQNYGQTGRIFDGSLGSLYGVKFWETDKAPVWADAGQTSEDVYGSLIFGQNAYGVVDLTGQSLQSFYKPLGSAGTADPINQQQSMGWKVAFTAKILNDAFMLRIESGTSTTA
jgi:N4-gp56 family major capsid protein